ncbi:MAG: lipoate--protein ligase [Desulfobacterales bacterium]|nr:lipoate--protein ligase [Desulfobacterales bacterium]
MLLIDNHNITDPAVNLALEEYCYRSLDPRHEYVLFYTNSSSIIFGSHQNPFQEINFELASRRRIQPVRRISGGGAVYHDAGNLNFSFITAFGEEKLDYFQKLLQPILSTLRQLGAPVERTEKNNIMLEGKKISGNSQHANLRRMLSHGTLLFDSDLTLLQRALQSNLDIVRSRAVASIPSRVTNISDALGGSMDIKSFLYELKNGLSESFGELHEVQLTTADWDAVHQLAEEKYRSWDWTFGRSPGFTIRQKLQFDSLDVEAHLHIKNAVIQDIVMPHQHPDLRPIKAKLTNLIGTRYDPANPDLKSC